MNYETGRYWDKPLLLVKGCTPCSPGCDNCWSRELGNRFKVLRWPEEAFFDESIISKVFAKKPTVFAIWNDLYHENVSDAQIEKAFASMEITKRHTYLILTKRSKRMAEFINHPTGKHLTLDNVYHGVTVCNQAEADEKIPELLKTPGHKFLSIEPLLEPISLAGYGDGKRYRPWLAPCWDTHSLFDCIIIGAETGSHRRPCNMEWIRSIARQCQMAGVPVWIKAIDLGRKVSHKMEEWPDDLRIREMPWNIAI
jgi:protein gp37